MADQAALAELEAEARSPNVTNGPMILRTCWSLIAISAAVLTGRIYSKLWKTRRLYWDDWFMVLAWLLGLAHAILITISVHYGLGRHLIYLSTEGRENTLKFGLSTIGPAFLSPMAGRIGFCITMLYLTGTDPRVKQWPIWMFMALQLVVNVSALAFFYSQCGTQLDTLWNPKKEDMYFSVCLNADYQTDYGYAAGAFNTLTDAFLTALPAVLIKHTRMSPKTKLGLVFLLCLSVLAMIASIVKTYEARSLSMVLDYTYALAPYIIWISVELNVVIIVSSIPLLRPLFHRKPKVTEAHRLQEWDSLTVGSIFSKKPKATLSRVDSEEKMIDPQADRCSVSAKEFDPGITITREVSVSYEASNFPFVHAALVGLIQGEIANPKLVKRFRT